MIRVPLRIMRVAKAPWPCVEEKRMTYAGRGLDAAIRKNLLLKEATIKAERRATRTNPPDYRNRTKLTITR